MKRDPIPLCLILLSVSVFLLGLSVFVNAFGDMGRADDLDALRTRIEKLEEE